MALKSIDPGMRHSERSEESAFPKSSVRKSSPFAEFTLREYHVMLNSFQHLHGP